MLTSKGGEAFVGKVMALERLGSESLIHIKLTSADMVTWRVFGDSDVVAGDVVRLEVDTINCHLFDVEGNAFPLVRDLPETTSRQTEA